MPDLGGKRWDRKGIRPRRPSPPQAKRGTPRALAMVQRNINRRSAGSGLNGSALDCSPQTRGPRPPRQGLARTTQRRSAVLYTYRQVAGERTYTLLGDLKKAGRAFVKERSAGRDQVSRSGHTLARSSGGKPVDTAPEVDHEPPTPTVQTRVLQTRQ